MYIFKWIRIARKGMTALKFQILLNHIFLYNKYKEKSNYFYRFICFICVFNIRNNHFKLCKTIIMNGKI
jgi:hypothetical protein